MYGKNSQEIIFKTNISQFVRDGKLKEIFVVNSKSSKA